MNFYKVWGAFLNTYIENMIQSFSPTELIKEINRYMQIMDKFVKKG